MCIFVSSNLLKGYGREAQSVDRKTADIAHRQSDRAVLVVRFVLRRYIDCQVFTSIIF